MGRSLTSLRRGRLDVYGRFFFRGHEGEEVGQRVAGDLVESLAADLEPFDAVEPVRASHRHISLPRKNFRTARSRGRSLLAVRLGLDALALLSQLDHRLPSA